MTRGRRNDGPRETLLETERKALELRRAGVTYGAIADRLGYRTEAGARNAVTRALARNPAADAAAVRELEHLDGAEPVVPLQTEVDPSKTRRKRDPGRCFLRAGWRLVGERRGLVILEAP